MCVSERPIVPASCFLILVGTLNTLHVVAMSTTLVLLIYACSFLPFRPSLPSGVLTSRRYCLCHPEARRVRGARAEALAKALEAVWKGERGGTLQLSTLISRASVALSSPSWVFDADQHQADCRVEAFPRKDIARLTFL